METPETSYARAADGTHIAYQTLGEGAFDLVYVPQWLSHIEQYWDDPTCTHFLERLTAFSRVVLFDKRGSGLSDPVPLDRLPTLESWSEDLSAVLDDCRSQSTAVMALGAGGALAALFAATYPERTRALVLLNSSACLTRRADYRAGLPPEARQRFLDRFTNSWGTEGNNYWAVNPSMISDPRFRARQARWQRRSASPGAVAAIMPMVLDIDVRQVLPSIQAPTLVLHRADNDFIRPPHGRYLAEHIPGARYVEVPGADQVPWVGDAEAVLAEVQEFLTGVREAPEPDRVLATVLFADIVDSTGWASRLGDHRWRSLLEDHDRTVRRQLDRYRGREIKTTGDGFLATFDGPARAIRCGCAIRDAMRALGLETRVGVHTGEVEVRETDVAGISVHTAQRVQALALPGEVLVSRTVVDLVAGSGIEFEDRGDHELKGISGSWRLFAVRG